MQVLDIGFGADAHAFGAHVPEGAGVSEPGHALFAEGVRHEGCGVAAQALGFARGGGVVGGC